MKRIIRLNAVKTSLEASYSERAGYKHPDQVSEVVNLRVGTVEEFVPTKKVNTSVTYKGENLTAPLLLILNQQPSVVPYLVVLSSIAFLVISLIWAMNTRVEEANKIFSFSEFADGEKSLKVETPKNMDVDEVALIPVKQLPLMVEPIVPFKSTATMLAQHPGFSLINLGDIQLMYDEKSHESVSGKVIAIFPSQTNNPVNYHTAIKNIPKQLKFTDSASLYKRARTTKVDIHTYRVADMFFEE